MNTYKCNKVLTTRDVIDSLLNSHGYPVYANNEEEYLSYDIGDEVCFYNSKLNKTMLFGTIRRKDSYPRKQYRAGKCNIEYIFYITFNAKVVLKLDNK